MTPKQIPSKIAAPEESTVLEPAAILECRCGSVFTGHTLFLDTSGGIVVQSREPCPSCGRRDNLHGLRTKLVP